jgi:aminoglycoside phosphotransferase (APT) family kinase protein
LIGNFRLWATALADFGYHLMIYRMLPLIIAGLVGSNFQALNIPSETDYVAAYCHRTGRSHIPDLDFYLSFSMFRFAGIIHGIKGRAKRGTAASDDAKHLIHALPIVAEAARDLASGRGSNMGLEQ